MNAPGALGCFVIFHARARIENDDLTRRTRRTWTLDLKLKPKVHERFAIRTEPSESQKLTSRKGTKQ
jgi:hypothetical protein